MSMHWSTMSFVFSQWAKCCACSAYIVSIRSVVVVERATVLGSLHPVGRLGETRSSLGGRWGTPRSCHPAGRWHKTDLRRCRRMSKCSERLRIPERAMMEAGMNRREFLVRVGGTLVAVPFVLEAVSCGDDNNTGPQPNATSWHQDGTVAFSHTHTVTFQCTDLGMTTEKTYTSTPVTNQFGTHTHSLTFMPAELAMIAAGTAVPKTSSIDSMHSHDWTVQKPAAAF